MANVTVTGGPSSTVVFNTLDAAYFGNFLANTISNTPLLSFTYSDGGSLGPAAGTNGALTIQNSPGQIVAVPTTDSAVVIAAAGPTSITGGAAGVSVLAGSGGLTYANITPSGPGTTEVAAGDGANFLQTSMTGGGNYYFATGAGNDTIGAFTGNATISAGSGNNRIQLGSGNSSVISVGFDSIAGNLVAGGGGTDTVNVTSGQTTINPGSSNFVVNDTSANGFLLLVGTGSDTVNATGTGSATVFSGVGGSNLTLTGSSNITATAGFGVTGLSPTINASGTSGQVSIKAGAGNDSLIAGSGTDTLAGSGGATQMVSGAGSTTFQFTNGQSGGTDTISGFKSADFLQFLGYGTPATSAVTGGSTVYTLGDGTKVTLSGVTSVNSTQIKTS